MVIALPIPDYQEFMSPLLEALDDQQVHRLRDLYAQLADHFELGEAERAELLPSGSQRVLNNRVGWAKTYLLKAGLVASPKRGEVQIAPRGMEVLKHASAPINTAFLKQFDEFQQFVTSGAGAGQQAPEMAEPRATPTEVMERAWQQQRAELEQELLDQVMACSPEFFERLVVDLMIAMGYGGSRKDAGEATRRSADGGIDGVIREDRLGLDIIYLQAKRWEAPVGRPDVQKFAGALQGERARKGVFITTSSFTRGARDYTANLDSRIVLIDGQRLAGLMLDHNVGVTVRQRLEIKQIDSDYFVE